MLRVQVEPGKPINGHYPVVKLTLDDISIYLPHMPFGNSSNFKDLTPDQLDLFPPEIARLVNTLRGAALGESISAVTADGNLTVCFVFYEPNEHNTSEHAAAEQAAVGYAGLIRVILRGSEDFTVLDPPADPPVSND